MSPSPSDPERGPAPVRPRSFPPLLFFFAVSLVLLVGDHYWWLPLNFVLFLDLSFLLIIGMVIWLSRFRDSSLSPLPERGPAPVRSARYLPVLLWLLAVSLVLLVGNHYYWLFPLNFVLVGKHYRLLPLNFVLSLLLLIGMAFWLWRIRDIFLSPLPERGPAPVRSARYLPVLLLLAAVSLVLLVGDRMLLSQKFVLSLLLLCGLAFWLWRVRKIFLSPLFLYDLARTARRGRMIEHRSIYACSLFVLLCLTFFISLSEVSFEELFKNVAVRQESLPRFASNIFQAFLVVQLLAVLVVAPAYVSGAIVQEKERRTFEYILVTDLTDEEIVLGMLMSRLANLFQIVLAGLPILGFVQFLGGVDPNQVLFGFAFTMLIMLSAGGISIHASAQARTHVKALVTSYLLILLFIAPLACVLPSILGNRGTFSFSSALFAEYDSPLMLFFLLIWYLLYHGSIAYRCYRLAASELRGKRQEDSTTPGNHEATTKTGAIKTRTVEPSPSLPSNHGATPEAVLGWGPFPEPGESTAKTSTRRSRSELSMTTRNQERRRPVGDDAMLWKELELREDITLEVETSFGKAEFLIYPKIGVMVVIGLLLIAIRYGTYLGENLNPPVRMVGTILTCLSALIAAQSASRRVSREYEQQTLESLLTTPLEPFDILIAKWLGSVWAARWTASVVIPFWLFGVLSGGLHIFALPLVLAAFVVQVAFLASLGLWFSVTNRSTMRATLITLMSSLVIVLGPGLFVRGVFGVATDVKPSWDDMSWFRFFLDYGLSYSVQAWRLHFQEADLLQGAPGMTFMEITACLVGMFFYLWSTLVLWYLMLRQFRVDMGPKL